MIGKFKVFAEFPQILGIVDLGVTHAHRVLGLKLSIHHVGTDS
jgi:hypothetical protein